MVLVCGNDDCRFEVLEVVGTLQAGDDCPRCKAGRLKAGRFAGLKDLDRLEPGAAEAYGSRAVFELRD